MNVDLSCKNIYWEVEGAARDFYDNGKINLSKINSGVDKSEN